MQDFNPPSDDYGFLQSEKMEPVDKDIASLWHFFEDADPQVSSALIHLPQAPKSRTQKGGQDYPH